MSKELTDEQIKEIWLGIPALELIKGASPHSIDWIIRKAFAQAIADFVSTEAAANKAAEEGSRHPWFCAHCQTGVPSVNVTFEEEHDPRAGGCGCRVGDWPVAAEEGDLPAIGMKMARELLPKLTSLHSRLRNPSSIKINSEADSMAVGDASALCRKLIAADRAARPVANKAEVEPIGYVVDIDRNTNESIINVALEPGTSIYTAPPATTGASTVPVDGERLYAAWHKVGADVAGLKFADFMAALGPVGASTVLTDERLTMTQVEAIRSKIKPGDGWDGDNWDFALANAVAREVAAQAGQVAVPDDVADAKRYRWLRDTCYDTDPAGEGDAWAHPSLHYESSDLEPYNSASLDAAIDADMRTVPSPAKESK